MKKGRRGIHIGLPVECKVPTPDGIGPGPRAFAVQKMPGRKLPAVPTWTPPGHQPCVSAAAPTTRLPRHAPHVLAQAPALPPRRPTIICAVTAEPRALHLASTRQLLWMRRREERLELSGERTATWCLAQPRRSLAHPHLPPHAPEPGRRPLPQQARSQQRRWRRSLWMQLHVPRRVRRTVSRRCGQSRGSPSEAAVVVNGVDLRAASVAASPELQRADAQTRLAPQHVDAVALASARSTNREPGMRIKPRIALRGGRGGQRRRFPCGLRCAPSEVLERADAWTRLAAVVWLQHAARRRVRHATKSRCGWSRGSPPEAAVVSIGGDPRAASCASAAAVSGAAVGGRADAAGGG
jgi:hypothetical protein